MNSSPPWRAATSPARIAPDRRWATSTRSRSPARWPSESLTTLKSSRSRNSRATFGPPPAPAREGPLDVVAEQDPVGQPGQRVVEGVVEELRLEALLVGRVDEQALRDAPPAAGALGHRVGLVVDPDDRAVAGEHPVVGAERAGRSPSARRRRRARRRGRPGGSGSATAPDRRRTPRAGSRGSPRSAGSCRRAGRRR